MKNRNIMVKIDMSTDEDNKRRKVNSNVFKISAIKNGLNYGICL